MIREIICSLAAQAKQDYQTLVADKRVNLSGLGDFFPLKDLQVFWDV